jgi:hypothetical protein
MGEVYFLVAMLRPLIDQLLHADLAGQIGMYPTQSGMPAAMDGHDHGVSEEIGTRFKDGVVPSIVPKKESHPRRIRAR